MARARLTTALAFGFAVTFTGAAALLTFGHPAKESRTFLLLLTLAPGVVAAGVSLLLVRVTRVGGEIATYRMGFLRGALVGLAGLAVFSGVMAELACTTVAWIDCIEKALGIFGYVMGVPVVAVSGLIGLLLEEVW